VSPGTGRRYPVAMICAIWRVQRSTVYAGRQRSEGSASRREKRGPKTAISDADVLDAIGQVLAESPFHTEGHKKVKARLQVKGIRIGRGRVLRLMRENRLLAPHRRCHEHGNRAHQGTITTQRPNELWGTDATKLYTRQEGWCWFFAAIDHCTDEIVGWHVAKRG